GALGAAVAARLRRRGDLARLQVGEEHRLLVLAGELEQSQPRRETLDRHHDRQTQNRERDQHLEQREAGMIPAAPAWPGRRNTRGGRRRPGAAAWWPSRAPCSACRPRAPPRPPPRP